MFLQTTMDVEGSLASFERPIDLVHLARQTLGDRDLEREILGLFIVQAKSILNQLEKAAEARARMDLAHTLKGSARAVGAWRVAAAAETCELLVDSAATTWQNSFAVLASAVREACSSIGGMQEAA